jgi:hypothetical protein
VGEALLDQRQRRVREDVVGVDDVDDRGREELEPEVIDQRQVCGSLSSTPSLMSVCCAASRTSGEISMP